MADWFPIVFGTFKVVALSIGMFFAVKWHYDQAQKKKKMDKRAVLRAAGMAVAIFLVSLAGLWLVTYALIRKLGLEFSFS